MSQDETKAGSELSGGLGGGKFVSDLRDPDEIIRALQDRIDELEPSLRDWKDMAMKYREALVWALGGGDDFPPEVEGWPFWWRIELQKRAGLIWNGKRFEDA